MKGRWFKRMIDALAALATVAVTPTLAFSSNEIEKAMKDGIIKRKMAKPVEEAKPVDSQEPPVKEQ